MYIFIRLLGDVRRRFYENGRCKLVNSDQVRIETGRDRLEWFTVLDVWEEGNRDIDQITQFLVNQRGVQPFWAKVVAANYLQSRP